VLAVSLVVPGSGWNGGEQRRGDVIVAGDDIVAVEKINLSLLRSRDLENDITYKAIHATTK
jgi:uncharacterized protein (DUF362 family)